MTHVADMGALTEVGAGLHMRQSRAEQLLRLLVEIPAILVVVAEVVILFIGIVARAVFNSPSCGQTNLPPSYSSGWRCSARP